MEHTKMTLEFGGEAAKSLDKLSRHLGMSPVVTMYHALNVLHKAVFPPLTKAASPAAVTKPPAKPSTNATDDVAAALEIAEEIESLAGDLPTAGEDFGMSVLEKSADIAATIEERGRVTDGQMEALQNMLDGLQRWFHD